MGRTAFWYASGWTIVVLSCPFLLLANILRKTAGAPCYTRFVERVSSLLARCLFNLSGSRIRIAGQEHIPDDGAVLFVSNHQGHVDSLIIHGFIRKPKGFISIVEVLKLPIIRTWMRRMRCVFLDRQDPRQSSACINHAVETLRDGHSMVVFPEGKLSDGNYVDEFNRGWLRLATRSGVPIVPVSISGSYKVLAKDGSRVRSTIVQCVISQPLPVADLKKADEIQFIESLRALIQSNLPD